MHGLWEATTLNETLKQLDGRQETTAKRKRGRTPKRRESRRGRKPDRIEGQGTFSPTDS